jgi:hypothetical protein
MSEDRGNGAAPPSSAAEAMYGPSGPISDGPSSERVRSIIEQGIAKPDPRFAGPREGGERSPFRQEGRSEPAFDSARYRAADGTSFDPTLMGEFSGTARELGISQRGGERLLEMHSRAIREGEQRYAEQLDRDSERLARSLPAEDIASVKELISDPQLTPPEMKQWVEKWGSHPAVARMLTAWARAIRNGRY